MRQFSQLKAALSLAVMALLLVIAVTACSHNPSRDLPKVDLKTIAVAGLGNIATKVKTEQVLATIKGINTYTINQEGGLVAIMYQPAVTSPEVVVKTLVNNKIPAKAHQFPKTSGGCPVPHHLFSWDYWFN